MLREKSLGLLAQCCPNLRASHAKWIFCAHVLLTALTPAASAGKFPTHTLTEDYALGMELMCQGYTGVYIDKPLVMGSAPASVRAAFSQRSRWCKVRSNPKP